MATSSSAKNFTLKDWEQEAPVSPNSATGKTGSKLLSCPPFTFPSWWERIPLSVLGIVSFCTFKSFHSFSLAHLQFPNIVFKIWRWKLDSNMGFINAEHCEWIILWFLCVTFWLMQPQIMFSFLITALYIADSYPWVTGWEWLFTCRILTCQFRSLWWLG